MSLSRPGPLMGFFWMLAICTLWSTAGVVSRQLELAVSGEVAFWRSLFCGITLLLVLFFQFGFSGTGRRLRNMGLAGLASGVFWAIMFTCFMVAIVLTTVTNTLLIVSSAPLFAAVLSGWVLRERISIPTLFSIAIAGIGLWWMLQSGLSRESLLGSLIAIGTPIAAACNLVLLKRKQGEVSFIPAVMLGGFISVLVLLPFIFPLKASTTDILWLAFLGVFQLAIPCSLMVWLSRYLTVLEISLLSLLEVILGPFWAWLWGGEIISVTTLQGGGLVLGALIFNTLARR